ncbi:MAG: hypothetical protein U0271_26640 [Polyangiaceae bacterium]
MASLRSFGLPACVVFGVAFNVGCGGTISTDGGGGSGGNATGASHAGGAGGDLPAGPCDGKSCGDPCSTCPPQAPCQQEACNSAGECVGAEQAVCSACPETAPVDGDACPSVGLVCEVEDGVVAVCRARATCTANGWVNEAPGCDPNPSQDPNCPQSPPTGNCDGAVDPALCVYTESTLCGCTDCVGGGPCGGQPEWFCAAPPEPPCPAVAPRLGDGCADEGISCYYGACSISPTLAGRKCQTGLWVDDPVGCPL